MASGRGWDRQQPPETVDTVDGLDVSTAPKAGDIGIKRASRSGESFRHGMAIPFTGRRKAIPIFLTTARDIGCGKSLDTTRPTFQRLALDWMVIDSETLDVG